MTYYFQQFREAHPRTKSFILNVVYMALLIIISTVWAYYNLVENRTDIPPPKEMHTPSSR